MSINIQTKKVGIPVTIGELEFFIDTSDNAMENIVESYQDIISKLESNKDVADMDLAKEVLDEGFEMLLGEGSFDKIYEQTPSAVLCAEYLSTIMEGVSEEINKQQNHVKKNIKKKYLTKSELAKKEKEVKKLWKENKEKE